MAEKIKTQEVNKEDVMARTQRIAERVMEVGKVDTLANGVSVGSLVTPSGERLSAATTSTGKVVNVVLSAGDLTYPDSRNTRIEVADFGETRPIVSHTVSGEDGVTRNMNVDVGENGPSGSLAEWSADRSGEVKRSLDLTPQTQATVVGAALSNIEEAIPQK